MDFIGEIQNNIDAIETRIGQIDRVFSQGENLLFDQHLANADTEENSMSMTLPPLTPESPMGAVSPGENRAGSDLQTLAEEAGTKFGIDPKLLRAVIRQESGGNPNAKSVVGAMGLMQLMPDTAKNLGVTDPYDARQNVFAGARYLKGLMEQFGGNLSLGLAAYNAGANAVRRFNGIPPYRETQNYVKNILHFYRENNHE